MYPVSDGRAVAVTGETLIDTVVLASRFIIRQDERTSANHLLDAESIDNQRPIVLCPAISVSHTFQFTYAWFPPFRCRSSVAVSPFSRCKIPLFCKNYVRKFRSVTAANGKKIRNGSGNGVRKRQRLTGTAKRQRKNGNGLVETEH